MTFQNHGLKHCLVRNNALPSISLWKWLDHFLVLFTMQEYIFILNWIFHYAKYLFISEPLCASPADHRALLPRPPLQRHCCHLPLTSSRLTSSQQSATCLVCTHPKECLVYRSMYVQAFPSFNLLSRKCEGVIQKGCYVYFRWNF